MRSPKQFYVYVMTNNSRSHVLYTGITGDLPRCIRTQEQTLSWLHEPYNLTRLVYCEMFSYPGDAIQREKEIKGWARSKKIQLIESRNPHWHDLASDWENLYKPVDRTPANAREILRGLAAAQDDVRN